MRLLNKIALISGGAQGMGAVTADIFAQHGAKVIIGDVLVDEGNEVARQINSSGNECHFVPLDVSRKEQWDEAVDKAKSQFGGLNVLVNNAGIAVRGNVEETSGEDWDQVMEVNAKGVFLGTKAVIPSMREMGGGSIINLSSIAGLVGTHDTTVYNASKAAVRVFTKSTALQYAKYGIRANSIHPGTIATPLTADLQADETALADRINRTPLGRLGTPEDVVYGAIYLASDESSFVTGSELVIDGGRTAE